MEHYSNFSLRSIIARLASHHAKQKRGKYQETLRARFLPRDVFQLMLQDPEAYKQAVETENSDYFGDKANEVLGLEDDITSFLEDIVFTTTVPRKFDDWVINRTQVLPSGRSIQPEAYQRLSGMPPDIDWTDQQQINTLFEAVKYPEPFSGTYKGGVAQWWVDNRHRFKTIHLMSMGAQELVEAYHFYGLSTSRTLKLLSGQGLEKVIDNEDIVVLRITTPEAAHDFCYSFDYDDWCIKDTKWASGYLKDSPIYYLSLEGVGSEEAYLFNPSSLELKNQKDSFAYFKFHQLDDLTGGLLEKEIIKYLPELLSGNPKNISQMFLRLFFFWQGPKGRGPRPWPIFEEALLITREDLETYTYIVKELFTCNYFSPRNEKDMQEMIRIVSTLPKTTLLSLFSRDSDFVLLEYPRIRKILKSRLDDEFFERVGPLTQDERIFQETLNSPLDDDT